MELIQVLEELFQFVVEQRSSHGQPSRDLTGGKHDVDNTPVVADHQNRLKTELHWAAGDDSLMNTKQLLKAKPNKVNLIHRCGFSDT